MLLWQCAAHACEDPVDLYEDSGIAYSEFEGEDWDGYPLIELHLRHATDFVNAHTSNNGVVLVHCFAGVNRSATLAIAILMMRGRRALPEVIKHCWEARPFILSARDGPTDCPTRCELARRTPSPCADDAARRQREFPC